MFRTLIFIKLITLTALWYLWEILITKIIIDQPLMSSALKTYGLYLVQWPPRLWFCLAVSETDHDRNNAEWLKMSVACTSPTIYSTQKWCTSDLNFTWSITWDDKQNVLNLKTCRSVTLRNAAGNKLESCRLVTSLIWVKMSCYTYSNTELA